MPGRFKLDSLSFPTLPSLSQGAALKTPRIELDLLTDIDMILFYENCIRGGVTRPIIYYGKADDK